MWRVAVRFFLHKEKAKQEIKTTMKTINKALSQIPADRSIVVTSRVNQVLSKYHEKMHQEEYLEEFLKALQFNLNFIKLSNPNIDFSVDNLEPEATSKQDQKKQQSKDQFQAELEGFDINVVKQYEKRAKQARSQVDFSNWFQGNADPENLKKHKQLLLRQNFGGQFWKDKEKPRSISKDYLMNEIYKRKQSEVPPEKTIPIQTQQPQIEEGDQYWEKVKR